MNHQLINPAESTASKTKYGWRFWTILIVTVLTITMNIHAPASLLYIIPINLIIWLLIVWLVRSIVGGIRYILDLLRQ